jgi:hypothetical protein
VIDAMEKMDVVAADMPNALVLTNMKMNENRENELR